jgi:hypothetical protein
VSIPQRTEDVVSEDGDGISGVIALELEFEPFRQGLVDFHPCRPA